MGERDTDEERRLKEQLRMIEQSARRQAKPNIDRLVQIEAMKPRVPLAVSMPIPENLLKIRAMLDRMPLAPVDLTAADLSRGISITGPDGERIDPADFYKTPPSDNSS